MAANTKKELENVIDDTDLRKKFKAAISARTVLMRTADDHKDILRENLAEIAAEYKVDKKIVSKLARTMYKSNYADILEENRHFEQMYEQVIEGRLRDPDDFGNPLDD